MKSKRFDQITQ